MKQTVLFDDNGTPHVVKQTVVFDFDGVIHSYKSGWSGVTSTPDEPVEGIKEAIAEIRADGYDVVVVSTRCESLRGQKAIQMYLDKHGIEVDRILKEKPPAIVYIDDRAICFDGNAGSLLERIRNFQPWNKRKMTKLDELQLTALNIEKVIDLINESPCALCKLESGQTCSNTDCRTGIRQYLESVVESNA